MYFFYYIGYRDPPAVSFICISIDSGSHTATTNEFQQTFTSQRAIKGIEQEELQKKLLRKIHSIPPQICKPNSLLLSRVVKNSKTYCLDIIFSYDLKKHRSKWNRIPHKNYKYPINDDIASIAHIY